MELNTDIKVFPLNSIADTVYQEINEMMLYCIINDRVPYVQDLPLPQDINIINGQHLYDINKIRLELKAAQLGAKSRKWIYGADASYIGLELKPHLSEPLICFANTKREEDDELDAQSIYLLDQFTDESIKRVLKKYHTDNNSHKNKLSLQMFKFISEYDSGSSENELRENKRKNISDNLQDDDILMELSLRFSNITQKYNGAQKFIFLALNNYYIKQETGLSIKKPLTASNKAKLNSALKSLAETKSAKLTQTLVECFLYSQRMTHYRFSKERVYTKNELDEELYVLAPDVSSFDFQIKPQINDNDQERVYFT